MNDASSSLFDATPEQISAKTWRTRPSTAHAVAQVLDNGYFQTLCKEMFRIDSFGEASELARKCDKCEERAQFIWMNAL